MDVFKIDQPAGDALPLIFDSPHSGREYPADFDFACPMADLKRAEDNMVDDLYSCVPRHGGTLLCALFPRTYIDVNRAETDIDESLLDAKWPAPCDPTSRSQAGIGLIRRLIRPGMNVYNRRLSVAEVQNRIATYYHPYHAALTDLIEDAHERFGQVWHINCHSMPSGPGMAGSDFVLGDRDGTSCDPGFTRAMHNFLRGLGYDVAINRPYKGVEIVRRSANPGMGRHSIQVEISKALYWNESTGEKSKNYNALKADIEKLVGFCAEFAAANLVSLAAD